jgi:hypothetical protein
MFQKNGVRKTRFFCRFLYTFCTPLQTFARFCPILYPKKSLKTGSISNNSFVCNTGLALGRGKLATKPRVNFICYTTCYTMVNGHASLSPPAMALVFSVAPSNRDLPPPPAPRVAEPIPGTAGEGLFFFLGFGLSDRPPRLARLGASRFPRRRRFSFDRTHEAISPDCQKARPLRPAGQVALRPTQGNTGPLLCARRSLRALSTPSRRLVHILLVWPVDVKKNLLRARV